MLSGLHFSASIVGELDLHRRQITFNTATPPRARSGEAGCGSRIDNASVAGWPKTWRLEPIGGSVELAVEGCTGWRFGVEEITAAGYRAHLAEPPTA